MPRRGWPNSCSFDRHGDAPILGPASGLEMRCKHRRGRIGPMTTLSPTTGRSHDQDISSTAHGSRSRDTGSHPKAVGGKCLRQHEGGSDNPRFKRPQIRQTHVFAKGNADACIGLRRACFTPIRWRVLSNGYEVRDRDRCVRPSSASAERALVHAQFRWRPCQQATPSRRHPASPQAPIKPVTGPVPPLACAPEAEPSSKAAHEKHAPRSLYGRSR
jgi:hypothetical protein